MPPVLRPFQSNLERDCYAAWDAGAKNIMPVSATGSGKTVLLSKLLYDEPGASIAIAHRQELVSQIAVALARNGVRHRIMGAKGSTLTRVITALQVAELGYSFIDATAKTGVGGVDTIIRMTNEPFFTQIRKGVIDEGHHVLLNNKWGKATLLFPESARWVFPTATPLRADGKGLGRHADGITDALILAPGMRDIINMGYLTDYRILCPKSTLDLTNVQISQATGDFNYDQLRKAVHESSITGDVVRHYLEYAKGKLGITFAVDVEEAGKITAAFKAAGVPAEVVSAKTPDAIRAAILRRFKRREILQLVNVDLFGEGFDLPAIEVVSFARPTESFALYSQQFGRALRLMIPDELQSRWGTFTDQQRRDYIAASVKPKAIVLDHVNNIVRHNGPPDRPRLWSLDRREGRKKKDEDAIPVRVCTECLQPFEAFYKKCPYCGAPTPPPAGGRRGTPEYVDGDLTELDGAALAALRGDIARIDGDFYAPQGLDGYAAMGARKRHTERQQGQAALRNMIAWWAGVETHRGYGESESYRRFYFRFGIDVANAQLLGVREAEELAGKINTELAKCCKTDVDGNVTYQA